MTLTPELILAFNIIFVSLITAVLQIYNSRRTARRDQLTDLIAEVGRLSDRVKQQDIEIASLREENSVLHKEIIERDDKIALLVKENERLRNEYGVMQLQIDELRLKIPDERKDT